MPLVEDGHFSRKRYGNNRPRNYTKRVASKKERFKTSGIDNKVFLESCFQGQDVIKDREAAMIFITFIVERIKYVLSKQNVMEEEEHG